MLRFKKLVKVNYLASFICPSKKHHLTVKHFSRQEGKFTLLYDTLIRILYKKKKKYLPTKNLVPFIALMLI